MPGRRRERFVERRKTLGLSQEGLAEAIGVETSTVARWERGETTPQPWHRPKLAEALKVSAEEVAELLASADASPVDQDAAVPVSTSGNGHAVHLHAWGALRTLEELAVFVRSDMLNRRDVLAASIALATGKTLVEPLARWFGTAPTGLPAADGGGMGRIGMSAVQGIERTVRQFITSDAASGGGLAREAAAGQLKYAVDLAQHASYSETVGNRLLTVIADLACWVGWMSHDAGMDGPAQRYFWYSIQAAHEAGTERAQLRTVGTLANLTRQAQAAGHLSTARSLVELAIDRVPEDRHRFNAVRGMVWNLKANVVSGMGAAHRSEVDRYVNLSFDLYRKSEDDEFSPAVADYFPYTCEAELASVAAASYRDLAHEDTRLTARAEQHARYALDNRGDGFSRSKVFDQVTLARVRLGAAEFGQACLDGQHAIQMASEVSESKRVRTHLGELMNDTTRYQREPAVRELREGLRVAVTAYQ